MTGRETILARVREALGSPTDAHVRNHLAHDPPTAPTAPAQSAELSSDADGFRPFLPHVGETLDDRKALFAEHSRNLKTSFEVVATRHAAHAKLRQLAHIHGWRKLASHQGDLTTPACEALGLSTLNTDGGYDKAELERCDAGITQCEALIAQTGSVLITPNSSGGRALSVLPPHHIVLATASQLLPDLPAGYAALREKYGASYPSMISFTTGPSRTGDIERILVLGAHGPKLLTVILIDD